MHKIRKFSNTTVIVYNSCLTNDYVSCVSKIDIWQTMRHNFNLIS